MLVRVLVVYIFSSPSWLLLTDFVSEHWLVDLYIKAERWLLACFSENRSCFVFELDDNRGKSL